MLGGEIERSVNRVMTSPDLRAEEGFRAEVLVPPGELFDPIALISRGDVVWLSDDRGQEPGGGGRIAALNTSGRLSTVADTGLLIPPSGFDTAPEGFGAFAGQIFMVAQPRADAFEARQDHVVLRVDPTRPEPGETFCTLPTNASREGAIPGGEVDARFGPPAGPFSGRFFAATSADDTVYQVTAGGDCPPFFVLDGETWNRPLGLAFSPDGTRMRVAVNRRVEDEDGRPVTGGRESGAILSVGPDGLVDPEVIEGIEPPWGIGVAPADFGAYGGELFFTAGGGVLPVRTQRGSGKLFRVSLDLGVVLVATGFFRPTGIAFVDGAIWVADIKADYIPGQQLPDGVIVRIIPE